MELPKERSDNAAWEKWLESREGIDCSEGKTEGQYLQNRLWRAFMAGINYEREKQS